MQVIKPNKRSRKVTWKDIPRVIVDSWRIKWAMLTPFEGKHPVASSISHCQVEENDPLRFFVLGNSWHVFEGKPAKLKKFFGFPWARTIINPKIVWHSKSTQRMKEGCMSLPKDRNVKRWRIIELEYWTFFGKRKRKQYLYRAAVVQHEINHMDNITTWDVYRKQKRAFHKSSYPLA